MSQQRPKIQSARLCRLVSETISRRLVSTKDKKVYPECLTPPSSVPSHSFTRIAFVSRTSDRRTVNIPAAEKRRKEDAGRGAPEDDQAGVDVAVVPIGRVVATFSDDEDHLRAHECLINRLRPVPGSVCLRLL